MIEDLQTHTQKLMERLLTAEQKLFELQDSYSQTDNMSMRSSRVDDKSFYGSRHDRDSDLDK